MRLVPGGQSVAGQSTVGPAGPGPLMSPTRGSRTPPPQVSAAPTLALPGDPSEARTPRSKFCSRHPVPRPGPRVQPRSPALRPAPRPTPQPLSPTQHPTPRATACSGPRPMSEIAGHGSCGRLDLRLTGVSSLPLWAAQRPSPLEGLSECGAGTRELGDAENPRGIGAGRGRGAEFRNKTRKHRGGYKVLFAFEKKPDF